MEEITKFLLTNIFTILGVLGAFWGVNYTKKTLSFSQKRQDFDLLKYAINEQRRLGTLSDIEKTTLFENISFFKGLSNLACLSILDINLHSKINTNEFYDLCDFVKIKLLDFNREGLIIKPVEKYRLSYSFILFNSYMNYLVVTVIAFLIYIYFLVTFSIDAGLRLYPHPSYSVGKSCLFISFIIVPEIFLLICLDRRKKMEWYEKNKTKLIHL